MKNEEAQTGATPAASVPTVPPRPCASTTAALVSVAVLAGFLLHGRDAQAQTRPSSPDRPPNVLWLVGENIALDLGCYGEPLVRTPNLDRLAAEGVRYTHVYATAPVCSASRSAFMTGMYQTTTGTHNARSHRDDGFHLPDGVRPITHRLRDAGYHSANVKTIDDKTVGTGKLDLNFPWDGKLFDSESWADMKAHQPFYAQVNTPEVEYDIYDRKSAEKERVEWVGEKDHPKIATPENVTPPPYYPDHPVTRQEWARYLNSVSGMDRRIGLVLEKLRADGLLEDTVVIFFADNGRLEPRGIHWCYDSGLHVPMIVRWPKNYPAPPQYRPGSVNNQVISLLDLTATTLAIAGIPKPKGMQSRIFLGADADPARKYAFSARDRIDETVQRIRSVHDGRFHYIRNDMPDHPFSALNRYKEKCFLIMPLMRRLYVEGKLNDVQEALMAPRLPEEELYDTVQDPYEIHNLATSSDPAHQTARNRLRNALKTWIRETGDQGTVLEPPEVVEPFEKEMHEWFGTPDWAQRLR
jgi:arylsulfatase A-like enzyme